MSRTRKTPPRGRTGFAGPPSRHRGGLVLIAVACLAVPVPAAGGGCGRRPSRSGRSRSQHPARHASTRCGLTSLGCLRRTRHHAKPRLPRGHRRALHLRPRARRRHAALARDDPHRPVSVRARDPRQHRLSAGPGPGHRGVTPEGARLRDRGLRRRLPARSPVRTRRRIRRLRRQLDPARSGEAGDRERRADAVVRSATDWIGRQGGKWFTWVHVYDPHATYSAAGGMGGALPFGSVSRRSVLDGRRARRALRAARGQSRPTLVVVTADHGESLGEHGELTHGLFAYESTLRVPLLIAEVRPAAAQPTGEAVRRQHAGSPCRSTADPARRRRRAGRCRPAGLLAPRGHQRRGQS